MICLFADIHSCLSQINVTHYSFDRLYIALLLLLNTRKYIKRTSDHITLYNSYQNESNDEDDRSIGDVVKNLHGGKYQFSDTQYLAGNSLIGQEFAENLYSSGGADESSVDEEDDELPNWVLRLQDSIEQSTKPTSGTLIFDEQQHKSHSITIKNDERSWEMYYAYILSTTSSSHIVDDSPFRIISPTAGVLAPRGGASNLCDESTPYLDNAIISIEWIGSSGDSSISTNEWLLVVGTEAEVWRYRLAVVE